MGLIAEIILWIMSSFVVFAIVTVIIVSISTKDPIIILVSLVSGVLILLAMFLGIYSGDLYVEFC